VSKIKHSAKSFFAECFFSCHLAKSFFAVPERKHSTNYLTLDKEPNFGSDYV
jgi:hypothetical protein